jgi:hypothetical protein
MSEFSSYENFIESEFPNYADEPVSKYIDFSSKVYPKKIKKYCNGHCKICFCQIPSKERRVGHLICKVCRGDEFEL